MDKPAEGLARVEEIHSGHLMRFALYIGDELVDRFSMKMAAEDEAEIINRHHASIVKPLREKAEKLEAKVRDLELPMADALIWRQACNDAEKDRDAWKEKAEKAEAYGKEYIERTDPLISCKEFDCGKCAECCRLDADRLAEAVTILLPIANFYAKAKGTRPSQILVVHAEEALAGHEALKGAPL